jgi:hypothetical protein
MTRQELLLTVLACAEGRPFTPVQIQKALFLISKRMPGIVTSGPIYEFAPYDYGPFDSTVYSDAGALAARGDVVIAPSGTGNWSTYAVSDAGIAHGKATLAAADARAQKYVKEVSDWVRAQSFSSLVKAIYDAYPEMKANSIFKG